MTATQPQSTGRSRHAADAALSQTAAAAASDKEPSTNEVGQVARPAETVVLTCAVCAKDVMEHVCPGSDTAWLLLRRVNKWAPDLGMLGGLIAATKELTGEQKALDAVDVALSRLVQIRAILDGIDPDD